MSLHGGEYLDGGRWNGDVRVILALLISWLPVTDDCLGRPLLFPGQVTYVVPYLVREMAVDTGCPLDVDGQPQACAVQTGYGEWPTPNLWFNVNAAPNPPIGAVYDVQEPVAVTPLHRSDDPCQ